MTSIREQCGCGSAIHIKHSDDPATIAKDWRGSHPCDRRGGTEREVVSGAIAEIAHAEPHRTDSDLGQRFGFTPPPASEAWPTQSADDTVPLRMPPATRRDLREAQ